MAFARLRSVFPAPFQANQNNITIILVEDLGEWAATLIRIPGRMIRPHKAENRRLISA